MPLPDRETLLTEVAEQAAALYTEGISQGEGWDEFSRDEQFDWLQYALFCKYLHLANPVMTAA